MSVDRLIGYKIKGYQITERLGSGGMGSVYRAVHPLIGKEVAIKTLHRQFSNQPEIVKRFFLEAKAANDIRHDNVIDILDFEETPEGHFLLMEYLRGKSLHEVITLEAPLPTERIQRITLQICAGLEAAHEKGIIHRDLKSENVFLTEKNGQPDFVKILDFGIAKLLLDSSVKTRTGAIMGTPTYLAPEQVQGGEIDARVDIYALGVLLYEMTTRVPPFEHPNPVALLSMHAKTPPTPPQQKNAKVNPKLSALIMRCLSKAKEQRHRSMKALALDLQSIQEEDEPTSISTVSTRITSYPNENRRPASLSDNEVTDSFTNPREAPTAQIVLPERRPGPHESEDSLTPIYERELILEVTSDDGRDRERETSPDSNWSASPKTMPEEGESIYSAATRPSEDKGLKAAVEKAKQFIASQQAKPLEVSTEAAKIALAPTEPSKAPLSKEPPQGVVPSQTTAETSIAPPKRPRRLVVVLLPFLVVWSALLTFLLLYVLFAK